MRILYTFLFLFFYITLSASNYTFDEVELEEEFTTLTKIESQVFESNFNGETIDNLKTNSTFTVLNADPITLGETNEFYVDWNSFAWGFCCCPVGFFTVAVNNNSDSDMKTSYWIGAASCVSLFAIIGTVSISFNYKKYKISQK